MKNTAAKRETEEQATTDLMAGGCLSVEQAAEFSAMGRSWLYQQMQNGNLPYALAGRRRLVPRIALQKLLASGLVGV
jgi:excisionase family DNA binding protein